ncbi:glycosyltransferase [Entomobacter blattae]|uniref:D-inositol-3-phosphate glycosyltransferase n=1 Tax=Entomobacter blattae TaxID=2762277 RepID=A0A7H1NQ81_9PROT|nr:glycosyltransferase [Entomobacter blattae]QNT77941.1 D-inositol-3-phosphate glycosyltransferase [Entomobacter blattae]
MNQPLMKNQSDLEKDKDSILESYRSSLMIQDKQIRGLEAERDRLLHQMHQVQNSLSWKVTLPLRLIRVAMDGRRDVLRVYLNIFRHRLLRIRQPDFRRRIYERVTSRLFPPKVPSQGEPRSAGVKKEYYRAPQTHVAEEIFCPSVLIVAELTLRQCAKYRVWQKKEYLESLGWECRVIDWRETQEVQSALQFCTQVIFYRVPGFDNALDMVKEAKRLGLKPFWEVDDLIFDREAYKENSNIAHLSQEEYRLLFFGVEKFLACLKACDRAIASTEALAQAMRDKGIEQVDVIENAIDQETLDIVADIKQYRADPHSPQNRVYAEKYKDHVVITYGSGTKTHNADFLTAAPALAEVMKKNPKVLLRIVGELGLPDIFDDLKDQVEYIESKVYSEYLNIFSRSDIAIAPLEETLFNECKSNIKYIEASVFSIPSVCSPRQPFSQIIRQGENGFLAQSHSEWVKALTLLVNDAELRRSMGEKAQETVDGRYSQKAIAEQQVKPVFPLPEKPKSRPFRVMSVNIYYEPRSFGGATFVAEAVNNFLVKEPNVEVAVFTSKAKDGQAYDGMIRYTLDNGVMVVALPLTDNHGGLSGLNNEMAGEQFTMFLKAYRPDVVHVHSIQGLGIAMLRQCRRLGIPYVLTLHDAWWLCERQFMVDSAGSYCFQKRVDVKVCQLCVPAARHLQERRNILRQVMDSAACLISPSASHAELYKANGVGQNNGLQVIKNGVPLPKTLRTARKAGTPIRFGYVGGNEVIKGFPLIERVFQDIPDGGWKLFLVDNKVNLGYSSINVSGWKNKENVVIVPAYNQNTMDDFYNHIDVLLFPSQWKESYGLTVREALVRDIWVISTSPGGQAEDIIDGVNGTLIPIDGKKTTLQEAVQALLKKPECFTNYHNPHKDRIATYKQQAEETFTVLQHAAKQHPSISSEEEYGKELV